MTLTGESPVLTINKVAVPSVQLAGGATQHTIAAAVNLEGSVADGTPPYTYEWSVWKDNGGTLELYNGNLSAVVTSATSAAIAYTFSEVGTYRLQLNLSDSVGYIASTIETGAASRLSSCGSRCCLVGSLSG